MPSRWQIHLSGMVVSRLNRKAKSIFTGSTLRRKAKSDSRQPATCNSFLRHQARRLVLRALSPPVCLCQNNRLQTLKTS